MAKLLKDRYKIPAVLRNDVQIAAAGEYRFGAGKNCDDFLCVFIGTGIGGAIVKNGEILPGAAGNAGEIGHTTIMADGRVCGCGGRGHLEAYASRTAMTRTILGELRRGRKSVVSELIPDLDPMDANVAIKSGVLRRAVKNKDEVVTETVKDAGKYLGYGLASMVNFVNPQQDCAGWWSDRFVDLLFKTAEKWTQGIFTVRR